MDRANICRYARTRDHRAFSHMYFSQLRHFFSSFLLPLHVKRLLDEPVGRTDRQRGETSRKFREDPRIPSGSIDTHEYFHITRRILSCLSIVPGIDEHHDVIRDHANTCLDALTACKCCSRGTSTCLWVTGCVSIVNYDIFLLSFARSLYSNK